MLGFSLCTDSLITGLLLPAYLSTFPIRCTLYRKKLTIFFGTNGFQIQIKQVHRGKWGPIPSALHWLLKVFALSDTAGMPSVFPQREMSSPVGDDSNIVTPTKESTK